MLFFGASTKGLHRLITLQETKSISHNEIQPKQRKTEEPMTYIGAVGWQIHLGGELPNPCSTSSGQGRFKPTPYSQVEGLLPLHLGA